MNEFGQDSYAEYDYSACGACSGGAGKLTKTTDVLGHESEWFYDGFDITYGGRLTKATDAIGKETRYFFDGDQRLTKVSYTSSAGTHDAFYHHAESGL